MARIRHPHVHLLRSLAVFLCLALTTRAQAQTPATNPAAPPAPHYSVTELRFPDSPNHGALNPPLKGLETYKSILCTPQGISENDAVTGWIVGADSRPHLFVYQQGKILKLDHLVSEDIRAVVSDEGIVAAVLEPAYQAGQTVMSNHLVLYKDGRLTDITRPGRDAPGYMTFPNARGELIHSTSAGSYLFSIRSGVQSALPRFADTQAGPNTFVGLGTQTRDKQTVFAVFAIKNGVTFWFPQSGKNGGPRHPSQFYNCAGGANDKGDFIFTLDDKCYFANAITHQSAEIQLPPNARPPNTRLYVTDSGDVYGAFGGTVTPCSGTPFAYHDGKTSMLSEIIPHATSLFFCTHSGTLVGGLDNNHLFVHAKGVTTDLGAFPGTPAFVFANNRNEILLNVDRTDGVKGSKVYLATGSQLVDLDIWLPSEADREFKSAYLINDHGLIVATAQTPIPNSKYPLRRAFVLVPESNNPAAPTPQTAPASARRP